MMRPTIIAAWLCSLFLIGLALVGETMADEAMSDLPAGNWQLVTDGVMGGVSRGRLATVRYRERSCVRLTGTVSTENNGGFIQMAQNIPPANAAALDRFAGIRVVLSGNNERYNLHLRTTDLSLPWQSYRVTVDAREDWQVLDLAFADFTPYKTAIALAPSRLTRIGVVAIGRAFDADVCVAQIGFYRDSR